DSRGCAGNCGNARDGGPGSFSAGVLFCGPRDSVSRDGARHRRLSTFLPEISPASAHGGSAQRSFAARSGRPRVSESPDVAFGQTYFSKPVFMVIGALRMFRVSKGWIFLILLAVLVAGVSGCNARKWLSASAQENGA